MIDLREEADGRLSGGYSGNTFNTAVYLVRLGLPVDYITALGNDDWSVALIALGTREASALGSKGRQVCRKRMI